MKNLTYIFFVLIILIIFGCNKKNDAPQNKRDSKETGTSQNKLSSYETDLSKYFEGYCGAFVLYDVENKYYIRHNEEQCKKRLSPCSTFKIPNSLIALETGIATDENFFLKWDGTKQWMESWNRDHTLRTAIANSVVWYYRELARRIGEEKMKYYVQKINYGNMDISGGLDKFWLMSSIEISANEQVEFLYKLYKNELPFSERTVNIVKDIMTLEKTDAFVLRGKTGSGSKKEDNYSQGWFVGYVEHSNNAYIFATNIISHEKTNGIKAKEITYEILKSLKLM
jgi:beta-lactamase class D